MFQMVLQKKTAANLNKTYRELQAKDDRSNINEHEQMELEMMKKCVAKDINDAITVLF